MSDNGAGSWAPPAGRLDVFRAVYIGPEPIEELTAHIDKVGTEESQPSYSPGWAQVSNTPLKWYKGNTYEGGIRAPLVIHWPAGELPAGATLDQYHHVIDIAPTLLEMIGHANAADASGEVLPLQGLSMAYTLDNPGVPTSKTLQHYETSGDRAIWAEGWKAVTRHQSGEPFEQDRWALYHAVEDFSEIHDLAAEHPDRLEQLVQLWRHEAEQNSVLPLDDDLAALFAKVMPQPRAEYIFYPGATRLERLKAPDICNYDYLLRADVVLGGLPANGVLLAAGDSMAGYELLMHDGWLEYTYIYTRGKQHVLRASKRLGAGPHRLELRGRKTGPASGRVEMLLDGDFAGAMDIPRMWPIKALNAGVRCGQNRGAPVSQSYEGAFPFDQVLTRVVVNLDL
jgi:arylsulfatase